MILCHKRIWKFSLHWLIAAEYFSPYQEDREQYKGFTNEDTVKKTAEEAYRKLLCHYKMDSFDELIKQSIEEDG